MAYSLKRILSLSYDIMGRLKFHAKFSVMRNVIKGFCIIYSYLVDIIQIYSQLWRDGKMVAWLFAQQRKPYGSEFTVALQITRTGAIKDNGRWPSVSSNHSLHGSLMRRWPEYCLWTLTRWYDLWVRTIHSKLDRLMRNGRVKPDNTLSIHTCQWRLLRKRKNSLKI